MNPRIFPFRRGTAPVEGAAGVGTVASAVLLLAMSLLSGCGKTITENDTSEAGQSPGTDAAAGDAAAGAAAAKDAAAIDASTDAALTDDQAPMSSDADVAAQDAAAPIDAALLPPSSRGQYLVDHVFACGECHTPRRAAGSLDDSQYLGGVNCFRVARSGDCLGAPNLTPDASGLQRFSDAELEKMIFSGVRPDDRVLLAADMPYYAFGAASPEDRTAVIEYLRTISPVENEVRAPEPAFQLSAPIAEAVSVSTLPAISAELTPAESRSAEAGRYLAALACVACHSPSATPEEATRPIDVTRAFSGGQRLLGRQSTVLSANLTPDGSGLGDWSSQDIVTALRSGNAADGRPLCAPMPAAFAGLTASDASAIATYLKAISPVDNVVERRCAGR